MLDKIRVTPNITAKDSERAKKFYSEKLGLKVTELPGPGVIKIECGENTSIFMYEKKEKEESKDTSISFNVPDIEKTVDDLTQKGVVFEKYNDPDGIQTNEKGISGRGPMKAAWFKDTEGNIIALVQPPS